MITNVVHITSDAADREEALREAEFFSNYHGLTGKNAMHIRLLTEESICLVDGILNGFKGEFWIESEPTPSGLFCRLIVAADVSVSENQEEQLLSVSTSGKNVKAAGILGKIRQLFRWTIQQADMEAYAQSNMIGSWYAMGVQDAAYWSLRQYTQQIKTQQSDGNEWDELEKSIIAKLADEVKVGIKSERAMVIIEKYIHHVMQSSKKSK